MRPGGGGSTHIPPRSIIAGLPTTLSVELSVWGAGSGPISSRYKDVMCYYKYTGSDKFFAVQMQPSTTLFQRLTELKRLVYECTLPVFSLDQGDVIEYYFDMKFDGHYNRKPINKIPIEAG